MAQSEKRGPGANDTVRGSSIASLLKHVEKLVQLNGEFHRLPVEPVGQLQSEFAVFETAGSVREDGNQLIASVDLGFRLSFMVDEDTEALAEFIEEDTDRLVLVHIRAQYLITYGLELGAPPKSAEVEDFCRVNAVHTAWPFWREFVMSSLTRGGLDCVPVPMFNVYGAQIPANDPHSKMPKATKE